MLGATQSRAAKDAHNRDDDAKMDSGQNKGKKKVKERCHGQANHHICNPETQFVVWPRDEKRIHERCKASNNNEGGRKGTLRKAQTEVDGQSAERFETTPARSKARTEPRSMEKCSHGDRPWTGIGSAKVRKITRGHNFTLVKKQSRLGVRKFSFSQSTINVWTKLSEECVHASSVNMFKNRLDKYLVKAGYT